MEINEGYYLSIFREASDTAAKPKSLDKSFEWLKRSDQVIPGAAQTYSKSWRHHIKGVTPIFLESGDGAVVKDVDGNEYPISKKKLPLEHIRKFPQLRVRTKIISSVARIRNTCAMATHNFFQIHDFKYVHTPIITSNDCEGAGETFTLSNTLETQEGEHKHFFGEEVGLTVSGQLHGETYACGLGDIYTFGPTFRAENSNTSRHLCEFWMIEPEMCFIDLNDLMNISEDYIKFCLTQCIQSNLPELEFFTNEENKLLERLTKYASKEHPFTRITYTEAISKLLKEIEEGKAIVRVEGMENKKFKKLAKGKHIFENGIEWGIDLASEHEKYLTDIIYQNPVKRYQNFDTFKEYLHNFDNQIVRKSESVSYKNQKLSNLVNYNSNFCWIVCRNIRKFLFISFNN